MDTNWTKDLQPDEAQAALDALDAHKTSVTARQAVELLRLRRALQKVVRADHLMVTLIAQTLAEIAQAQPEVVAYRARIITSATLAR
jgi:hypothetical protein